MTADVRASDACDAIREALPAALAGEREAEVLGLEASAIEAHLVGCASCQAEREAATRVRGWLAAAAAPDAAEATDGLARLLAAAGAEPQDGAEPATPTVTRPARAGTWRLWLGTAAAAALLVGTVLGLRALGVGGAGRLASEPPPPTLVAGTLEDPLDGSALDGVPWRTRVRAGAGGATVARSGRWTAALRGHAEILPTSGSGKSIDGVERLTGATLWHVVPGGGAVQLFTPHAIITVRGTVLLVDVAADRTTVAVYDGRVEVRSHGAEQPVTVDAGRAVVVAADRAPEPTAAAPAPPDWLPASPTPQLTLAPPDGPIVAGVPAWCRLTLTNPGPGVCVLPAPNARDPNFAVSIAPSAGGGERSGLPPGTADAQALRRLAVRIEPGARAVVAGLVVLGSGESFAVACDVGSGCTEPGRFELVARYVAGTDAPTGTFVGTAASPPCPVEVRAP